MNITVPIALIAAVSLVGAVVACAKAVAETGTGRQAGLWVMALLLSLLALGCGAAAYWLWRFSEEFSF